MTHTVYLGLGANVGDKRLNIQTACVFLQKQITDITYASIYETKPWGYATQKNFLNTVVYGKTMLTPEELLQFIKNVEKRVGRIKRFTNCPREIDIDILFYDNLIYQTANLHIPHPRLAERDFVLQPLVDLNPNYIHPILHKTTQKLLQTLKGERYIINRFDFAKNDTCLKIQICSGSGENV